MKDDIQHEISVSYDFSYICFHLVLSISFLRILKKCFAWYLTSFIATIFDPSAVKTLILTHRN